MLDRKILT